MTLNGVRIVALKSVVGVGCLVLSLGAMGEEPNGGLEGMINQMEKHGASRNLQLGMPADDSGPAAEQQAEGPSENPVTRVITPGRPAVPPQAPAPASASTSTSTSNQGNQGIQDTDTSGTVTTRNGPVPVDNGIAVQPRTARGPVTPPAAAQALAAPAPPRPNPLAEQPLASGGLEQIINIMELNASRPMRASPLSPEPEPGATSEASLREKMAR
jgi:hypothetical protein